MIEIKQIYRIGGAEAGATGYGYWAVHWVDSARPNQEQIETVVAQDEMHAYQHMKKWYHSTDNEE